MAKKQVIAVFTVDTEADGQAWQKEDIALALACKFDDNHATAWDSLSDFLTDVKEGYFPNERKRFDITVIEKVDAPQKRAKGLRWGRRFDRAAFAQGWSVFTTDHGPAIQRIDDPKVWDYWEAGDYTTPKFDSDDDARLFVRQQAHRGSPVAIRALEITDQE